ncbi:hypothetical protein PVAND_010118 [Polypedilum vanderplanki]|uniref:Uncharacterized protein n=1 Tax=Polypedilum vanderplanki TaxID=319348 RepID=A0A9J6CFP3_POLVA|nr:hypothetical protein PVAND_010118 [Polypedilum vanderplanki]
MSESIWDECLHCSIPIEMLDLANHPTPSDLEKRMGAEFVDMFFKTCSPIEKVLFGRDKPLKGPDEKKLWINPADKLKASGCGGVYITEQVSRTDCLQALTHRGIMEIGEKIEAKITAEHENTVAEAVKETEELERFETNLRIEFHVKEAVKKVNEEWQQRYNDLSSKYEEEKENLIKIFQDGRKVFCEYLAKKCQNEIDKSVEKAITDTRREMEEKCSRAIDDELAQQQAAFQKSMEVTLNNLKANDRDRMNELRNQCLKAMDVQSHLMMCRQITELMHMMSVEKEHWRKRFKSVKEEYEKKIISLEMRLNSFVGELSREHQSKSIIIALWRKFFKSLNAIDVDKLTQHEQRLFYEFQQIQCDLIESYDNDGSNFSRIFTLESEQQQIAQDQKSLDNNEHCDDDNMDCCFKNIDECIQTGSIKSTDSSVAVKWEQQYHSPTETNSNEDSFMSSIFHGASQTDAEKSAISKIASSIIAMVRNSTDEQQLKAVIAGMLNELARTRGNLMTTAGIDLIILPKVVSELKIRDSKEIIEKRISFITNETVEHPLKLLSAIDSLEILSRQSMKDKEQEIKLNDIFVSIASSEASINLQNLTPRNSQNLISTNSDNLTPQNSIESNIDILPSYMKIPCFQQCDNVEKWNQLKLIEEVQSKLLSKSQRKSSITFSETPRDRISSQSSERHSILKQNSKNFHYNELKQEENVLFSINEKCRETLKNMKVKSILQMLCDDDTNNNNINGIESNSTLSSEEA